MMLNGFEHIDAPCGRDCPKRAVGCRGNCIPWKEYEVIKKEQYAIRAKKRERANVQYDYHQNILKRSRRR